MEKRDAFILLLVLGGGGYAAYTHWDVIAEKLSLADLSPGRLKAVDLAKNAADIGNGFSNWQWLESRSKRREIELPADPWIAEPLVGEQYRVTVRWLEVEDQERIVVAWKVDIGKRTVEAEGVVSQTPASPR